MPCKDQTVFTMGRKTAEIWGSQEVHPNHLSPLTPVPDALTLRMKTDG